MRWLLKQPFVAFDTESTGLDTETAHIVTASIVRITHSGAPDVRSWLAAVDVDIEPEAVQVHGITTDHAREHGRKPGEVVYEVRAALGAALGAGWPLVVANGPYDFTLLDRNLRRYGLPPLTTPVPVLDVQVVDKYLDPYRKGTRRLSDPTEGGLVEWYGVKMDGAHDSTFDALATARVAWRIAAMTQWPHERLVHFYHDSPRHTRGFRFKPEEIADRFVDLAQVGAAQLHANQVRWRGEQQRSLRAHFEALGKTTSTISEEWPMVAYKEEKP